MHVKRSPAQTDNVVLGIGDDAAIIEPPAGELLAISVDTLIAGRHFPEQTSPSDIGYKSLAVNLSDMAAMGAIPRWITLSLALPEVDERFLSGFSEQLLGLAERYGVQLIGGDTVRGPLTITVQIIGTVPANSALKRSGARVGDAIFVSGTLGDAAGGLSIVMEGVTTNDAHYLLQRLNRPTPRVELGRALRGVASSAIDISDGLLADLGHILEQSGVGAEIDSSQIPCSDALISFVPDRQKRLKLMAAGGDDYELCFPVPASRVDEVKRISEELKLPLTQIGKICEGFELLLDGEKISQQGFDHFKGKEHGS
ncbi:MAG: thiamine-phosphate kinase [Gammaproteobacteria bacterium]|nr:thiamine-phosphate kinase [Gammaproteobacteria bacterium]